MRFVPFSEVAARLRGKRVAIVGSAPSCQDNTPGFIDGHDEIIRINNYKLGTGQGWRCTIHYSFYGTSVKKTPQQLLADGVDLCWCKCPDSKPIACEWHERMGKQMGIDFRYIYRNRIAWWPTDVCKPTDDEFLAKFELLGRHIPTTGFSAILDVMRCQPKAVYLTGFDFFSSGTHNVNEPWRPGDAADPIGHRPDLERQWLADHLNQFIPDAKLRDLFGVKDAR